MKGSMSSAAMVLVLVIAFAVPSLAATNCSRPNPLFAQCMDLVLGASLLYNYNSTNASMSFAFTAKPPSPDGWVAWGINPTATGMDGTQAFVAYKEKDVATVKTFDVKSPVSVLPAKLSFDYWGMSTSLNSTSGEFTIRASVKVPNASKGTIEHVWQAGSVANGLPATHPMLNDNKMSHGPLTLVSSEVGTPAPAPAPTSSSTNGSSSSPSPTSGAGGNGTSTAAPTPSTPPSAASRRMLDMTSISAGIAVLCALVVF